MDFSTSGGSPGARRRVLWLSTFAFTALFAVWLMLGVLGLEIKKDAGLMLGDAAASMTEAEAKSATETRFEWLLAVAILSGSLLRLSFGIWADRYGGRNLMVLLLLLSAVPTYWLGHASSYPELLACAALFGLAGNSFSVGIAWNSAWLRETWRSETTSSFSSARPMRMTRPSESWWNVVGLRSP